MLKSIFVEEKCNKYVKEHYILKTKLFVLVLV
jgi:hypothetical protein